MMKVSVVIASLGRAENLYALLKLLEQQTVKPHSIVLSLEKPEDCPPLSDFSMDLQTVFGPRGSTYQRNRGLDQVRAHADAVVFLDDDYVPSRYAIAGIAKAFETFPDVGGINGKLLADGINSLGINEDEAAKIVEEADKNWVESSPNILKEIAGLYGCNMAYRMTSVGDVSFDEALPLYAWQEDIDFSVRVKGRKILTDAFYGVHCGTKRGRETKGKLLGYSQIANVLYLMKKGTLTKKRSFQLIGSNMAANHLKYFFPEPWVDRKGRVFGNWYALFDILRGKCQPDRILDL